MRASGSLQPTLVTCVLWQGREEVQCLWMAYERVRKDRVSSGTANHILWWCICNSSFLNRQELVVLEVTMPWSVWMWNTIFFCCVSSSECMQFTARTGIRQSLSHNRPCGYWYMEIFFLPIQPHKFHWEGALLVSPSEISVCTYFTTCFFRLMSSAFVCWTVDTGEVDKVVGFGQR